MYQFDKDNAFIDLSITDVVPPRKTLAPVFIVEEDIRPLDLSANVDRLIVKGWVISEGIFNMV